MRNLAAKFGKIFDICKKFSKNLVDERGNMPRRGVVPRFSDLEVIALSLTAEQFGVDSESYLFALLKEYKSDFPNLISRRQYNDRRKFTANLCEQIRKNIAQAIDAGEDVFCADSKPVPVCRIARAKRCRLGKYDYHRCTILGDKGYLSASVQLDLFETSEIRLEVPYRLNQKDWKPTFAPFAKARKRVETLFSQMVDQFMLCRNYAKQQVGLFARIISKISALTILQYIKFINNKPIGRVKYALI